jgi:predicted alpha/beta superfamily hydrolase
MRIAVSEEGDPLTKPARFLGFLALFSQSQGLLFDREGETRPSPQVETFELQSQVFKNIRTIRVMLPDGYSAPANATRKYPVLYLNDGFAVFKPDAWNAPQLISDLIRKNIILPIVLVGIDNGASIENGSIQQRTREYLPYVDTDNEPDVPILTARIIRSF